MIADFKITEAEALLKRGDLSQRAIARITGLSRGTIGNLAKGRRQVYEKKIDSDMPPELENSPPVRCPCCGGMVRMPCLFCFLNAQSKQKKKSTTTNNMMIQDVIPVMTKSPMESTTSLVLGVSLVGEELKRYQEIRTWREKQRNPFFVDIPESWPWRKNRKDKKCSNGK